MELLEREGELAELGRRLERVASGGGSVALVAGEAGIGKTSLVRAFLAARPGLNAALGAAEQLATPRPLGPLLEVAERLAPEVLESAGSAPPGEIAARLLAALERTGQPVAIVLEDLHWADGATLDGVRFLARRVERLPGLLVLTFRDDEIGLNHPLRPVLGDLVGPRVARLRPSPLSVAAVAHLAAAAKREAAGLHERTGGNPFYLSEMLAGGEANVPISVRDAVLGRAARLDERARRALEAAAIVPGHAERWLLEVLLDGDLAALDAAAAGGLLVAAGDGWAFRHELARLAVESSMPIERTRELHARALATIEQRSAAGRELSRLVHHAERAGVDGRIGELARAAGLEAARLGAHREAAAHFARALEHAAGAAPAERADLYERYAYECYLTDRARDAFAAREAAYAERLAAGDPVRAGDDLRWMSRLSWFLGRNADAERYAAAALAMLEPHGASHELAMALSNRAQLLMLEHSTAEAVAWGERAIAMARALGDDDVLVHALNNVGTALAGAGRPGGWERLEESLERAVAGGFEEHAARAWTNLGSAAVALGERERAARWLDQGIAFCRDHDLDSWNLYMTGWRARLALDAGRFDDAADDAERVLAQPGVAPVSRISALVALGLVRTRRGDAGGRALLDEAWSIAGATGEAQRLLPAALARAELAWLAGEPERGRADLDAVATLAEERGRGWEHALVALWRRRLGAESCVPAIDLPDPIRHELEGRPEEAAAAWRSAGDPYAAALALATSARVDSLRRALAELEALGAPATADRLRVELARRGHAEFARRPRRSTRARAHQLTAREVEVVALLAEGLSNAEIADRLFIAAKTVDHHVSSILGKLGAANRARAGHLARQAGLI